MAFILTRPNTSAAASSGSLNATSGVISANSILTLDSVDTNISNTVKWFIELIDNTNQKMESFEVYAHNRFNTLSHNKTNILGDNITYDLAVIINGNNINLNISNNEAVDLNYKFVKIQL